MKMKNVLAVVGAASLAIGSVAAQATPLRAAQVRIADDATAAGVERLPARITGESEELGGGAVPIWLIIAALGSVAALIAVLDDSNSPD